MDRFPDERDQDEHGVAEGLGAAWLASDDEGTIGHWNTMTFVAALHQDRVDAPWHVDCPINGERFKLYIEKVLVPTLGPGDIAVMDNLGSHRSKAVRQAIRAAGAKLFL